MEVLKKEEEGEHGRLAPRMPISGNFVALYSSQVCVGFRVGSSIRRACVVGRKWRENVCVRLTVGLGNKHV